jgi:hypothetical protein
MATITTADVLRRAGEIMSDPANVVNDPGNYYEDEDCVGTSNEWCADRCCALASIEMSAIQLDVFNANPHDNALDCASVEFYDDGGFTLTLKHRGHEYVAQTYANLADELERG